MIPLLYRKGQDYLGIAAALCKEYGKTFSIIETISLKNLNRPLVMGLMDMLEKDLLSLVPENFPLIYDSHRMKNLKRYVAALGIRAARGAEEPLKDAEKAGKIEKYKQMLDRILSDLSPEASMEKAKAVEDFFYMMEEYKISVFAQELKTNMKISPKRLDAQCRLIKEMV